MSGKPKKNKAPKAAEPAEEAPIEEVEEQFVEETVVETVPGSKGNKADAEPKKKKSGKGFKVSSIDPIILASFTIFMVACLIVSGITIYGVVAGDGSDKKVAEYGDKIEVRYTGSYINYYDVAGAVIFDTNMQNVGDSDDYKKSFEYTKKTSYTNMQMTVGQGSLLDGFKNALIGHRPGDIVKVEITDGYGSLTEGVDCFQRSISGLSIGVTTVLTVDDYKTFFKQDTYPTVGTVTVKSPYGWDAEVGYNIDGTVTVSYLAEKDKTYDVNEGSEDLKATVTDVSAGTITYSYVINANGGNAFDKDSGIMLKAAINNKTVYVIGFNGTDMFDFKTVGETVGTKMYFTIEFVKYA